MSSYSEKNLKESVDKINTFINIRDAGIALLNNPIKTKEEKSSRRRAIKM